ncbi:MAG: DNA integrity scanning protein DisA [Lentisphaerae bacterium ADurb.BinA184]|nr:MAG: DNA integrity scanning protein DisA [Lentisphaerae bacterium ADurb.BinA184]
MTLDWKDLMQYGSRVAVEIGLLTLLAYSVLYFLRGTRATAMLAGGVFVAIVLRILSDLLGLDVIAWLVERTLAAAPVLILIIFQSEIRRVLAGFGSGPLRLRTQGRYDRARLDTLLDSAVSLASHRIGALIAIERDIGLRAVCETGTFTHAVLSRELLTSFFFPNAPLHDGGVVVKADQIVAAGCIFPLTHDPELSKSLGTRHRAAVGLTEETDAVVIVVSEETGAISLAVGGRLTRGLNREQLDRHLTACLQRRPEPGAGRPDPLPDEPHPDPRDNGQT